MLNESYGYKLRFNINSIKINEYLPIVPARYHNFSLCCSIFVLIFSEKREKVGGRSVIFLFISRQLPPAPWIILDTRWCPVMLRRIQGWCPPLPPSPSPYITLTLYFHILGTKRQVWRSIFKIGFIWRLSGTVGVNLRMHPRWLWWWWWSNTGISRTKTWLSV